MADQDMASPHAGSYYRFPLTLEYLLWWLQSVSQRMGVVRPPRGAAPETVPGIDVSHWQGDLTEAWWSAAHDEGYRFVFLKATEGRSYIDPRFEANKAHAQEAGFKVGGYHFARPQYSGLEQAELFMESAGDLDLGGAWDLEYAGGASGAVINARTEEFLSTLNQRYGYSWMYSAAWFLDPRKIHPQVAYYRWVAHWTKAESPYMPKIWRDREYDSWQYTSRGTVAGKRGIDLNRMRKTLFDELGGG